MVRISRNNATKIYILIQNKRKHTSLDVFVGPYGSKRGVVVV